MSPSGRRSTDIVGYTFQAEMLCPTCVIKKLPTGPGGAFDGWGLVDGVYMSTEDNLREIALAFGIDYTNEHSYDSADFPKVVFGAHLIDNERCDRCGEEL